MNVKAKFLNRIQDRKYQVVLWKYNASWLCEFYCRNENDLMLEN